MAEPADFRRVAIVGTGLIGASFGAAVEKACSGTSIVAHDRPEVLRGLRKSQFRWEMAEDLTTAIRGADLVYVALPVGAAIDALPAIALNCEPNAFVTDAGSTKERICKAARNEFRGGARFLGGHPIAGKEAGGWEHADPDLFREKRYVVIEDAQKEEVNDPRVTQFLRLLHKIGAEPVWCDAETHDWAMAVVSQMPQLLAIALAQVISDETDETGLPASLAGSGLRDMLRTSGSPYDVWRDICMTNTENIARSLDRVAQAVDFLRTHLAGRELEKEFSRANEVYKMLHEIHPARNAEERTSVQANEADDNG